MDEARASLESRRELRLAIVGDAMLGVGVAGQSALPMSKSDLWKPVDGCDAVLVNLESPITAGVTPLVEKKYLYKMDPALVSHFDRRFIIGLANNHLMDFGADGLRDTLAALETRNLTHCGAGRSLEEARRPAIVEIRGVRLAIVCAADPRYQAAGGDVPGTCPAKPEMLRETLRQLRGKTDHVVVSLHMGLEFVPYPTGLMAQLAELCLEEGAGVVVFHHSHVLGGQAVDRRGVVLWGTGNYLFPPEDTSHFPPWFESAAWIISLPMNGGAPWLENVLPVVLDRQGRPALADTIAAARIRQHIERLTARSRNNWRTTVHRCLHLLGPGYLKTAGANYVYMVRHQGWPAVLRSVYSTVRTQFGRHRLKP